MLVRLEEMKLYLRVDSDEEDELITHLLESAEKVCMDVVRGDANALDMAANTKTAIMYTAAYFYEHREEADYRQLMLTLRSLFFAERRGEF